MPPSLIWYGSHHWTILIASFGDLWYEHYRPAFEMFIKPEPATWNL